MQFSILNTPDPTSALRTANEDLAILLSEATLGDLGLPTPTPGWDLGDLYAHLLEQNAVVAATLSDNSDERPRAPAFDRSSLDSIAHLHGGGFEEPYRRGTHAVADLFTQIDIGDSSGRDAPQSQLLLDRHVANTVLHTWDVARALGLDYEPTPVMTEHVLRTIEAARPVGARFAVLLGMSGRASGFPLGLCRAEFESAAGRQRSRTPDPAAVHRLRRAPAPSHA